MLKQVFLGGVSDETGFQAKKPRRFDAYMIYSEQRKRMVDY